MNWSCLVAGNKPLTFYRSNNSQIIHGRIDIYRLSTLSTYLSCNPSSCVDLAAQPVEVAERTGQELAIENQLQHNH